MAAKPHMALFFEAFVKYNLDRYQDNAVFLPLFQGLTLGDVTITDITTISTPVAGSRRSSVSSISRNFRGIKQDWTPAIAEVTPSLFNVVNKTPLANFAEVEKLTAPGLYTYVDSDNVTVKVAVVISADTTEAGYALAVEQTLRAALVYDIPETKQPTGEKTIELVGETFGGKLPWVKALTGIVVIPPTYYGVLDHKKPL